VERDRRTLRHPALAPGHHHGQAQGAGHHQGQGNALGLDREHHVGRRVDEPSGHDGPDAGAPDRVRDQIGHVDEAAGQDTTGIAEEAAELQDGLLLLLPGWQRPVLHTPGRPGVRAQQAGAVGLQGLFHQGQVLGNRGLGGTEPLGEEAQGQELPRPLGQQFHDGHQALAPIHPIDGCHPPSA